ncbi:hypothetical protein SO802_001075 [Lithocarpus litseifolius]|uniref:DUF7746 domain-containing protein n=1 Tax=Lithocarpus litseifolius TaxID=425828 RepID=A0AAW2DUA8_9ROSI
MGHMSMVGIAYQNNHNLDQLEIVELLVTGFSGTLHGWWDSYLTEDSRESIKHVVKKNNDGLSIFDESIGKGIPDGVKILNPTKGKYFNCGKPGHYSKNYNQKHGKLKNKLNMLNINDEDKEDLFRILESNNLFDSLEDNLSSSSDSCYHSADEYFGSPNVKLGCRDSCCNVTKTVNGLTKSDENENLLIKLISQIQNPELQEEYLDKLKKNLTKDENVKKLKSKISFEETLERFNKKKSKELTVNDLQYEIAVVKQEIIKLKDEFKTIKSDNVDLKQELLLLRIDKNLDKHQSDNGQNEHKDGDVSSQGALLFDKGWQIP